MRRKALVGIFLVVIFVSIIGMFGTAGASGGEGQYQKEIIIKENSGKTLTDYQIMVELKPSNFPDKAKPDGSDLRFAEDGKELSYWIEDYDAVAKTARIWVKVPGIPANGETRIMMYYGDEEAGSVSDGDKVFEFFDDFNDNSLDSSKWDKGPTCCVYERNKRLELITSGWYSVWIVSKDNYDFSGSAVTIKVVRSTSMRTTDVPLWVSFVKNLTGYCGPWLNDFYRIGINHEFSKTQIIRRYEGEKTELYEWPKPTTPVWYRISLLPDNTIQFYESRDGVIFVLKYSEKWGLGSNKVVYFTLEARDTTSSGTWYDDFIVRKYTSPEPTITIYESGGGGCGRITNWKTMCQGVYSPEQKVGAEMEFENLMGGGYNFKGVIIIRSPTGDEYTNSEVEWVPSAPNPQGKFAAGDALYVTIPEGASAGNYDMKLELWNDDTDELCDETEWKEDLFTVGGNKCPMLSDGKVEPLEGGESTNFVFSVTYKDEDGDEPVGKYVRIIGFQGTNKVYDETKEMIRGSGDITMGVTYTYSTTLPAAEFCFYFYFSDGECAAYLPEGGYPGFDGPNVTGVTAENHPPTATKIEPTSDSITIEPGDTQEFKVKAEDVDEDVHNNLHMIQWFVDDIWVETDAADGTSAEVSFSYTFENAGTSYVKATVYDEQMEEDSVTWDVNVGIAPKIISFTQVPSNPVGTGEVYYVVTYKNDEQDESFVTLDIQNGNKVMREPIEYVKGRGQLSDASKAAVKGNMAAIFEKVLDKLVDKGLLDFFNDYLGQDLDSFLDVEDAIGFKIFSQVYSNDDYGEDYDIKVIVEDEVGKDSKALTTKVRKYYIGIIEEEIEDTNSNPEDGIQVEGIITIPFRYCQPPLLTGWKTPPPSYKIVIGEDTIVKDDEYAKVKVRRMFQSSTLYEPKILTGTGKESIELTTHLFENTGMTKVEIIYMDGWGNEFPDTVTLDFQNDVKVTDWEDKFSEWGLGAIIFEGEWDELGHADITESELGEYFGGPYEHVSEVNQRLSQQGFYDITFLPDEEAGEFEFVGDVEKKKDEWLPKVSGGLTIVGLVLLPPIGWFNAALTLVTMAGQELIFTGGEEIYKVTQPEQGLQYKWVPSGDLEGNIYLLFIRTSAKRKYVNGVLKFRMLFPFYLSQSGKWEFPTQKVVEGASKLENTPAIITVMEEGAEWESAAECVEWLEKPTSLKVGVPTRFTLKIRDGVVPNLHDSGMHLDLEIPGGVEISNVLVKGGEDAEAKAVEFYRVSDLDKLFAFKLTRTSSEKGAARVAINIPKVYHGTEEIVSFDLTIEEGEVQQDPVHIFYGLIPAKVHSTGYYSGCYFAAHGIRERWGEYEDANPLTVKQPERDSSSAGCSWIYFYEPYDLKHRFEIMPTVATETFTNTIGMEFVPIPAGEFEMGSPPDEAARRFIEGPVHHVNIEKAFYMGRYEVTQNQWRAIMGDNPSVFTGDDLPVEGVSWNDVQEFIKRLNEKEGADKYRLPSEAEWEYACRAGTTTRYSFGDSESKLGDYAWYVDNSDRKAHPVGQKNPNSWRLYDMHGNVWEWVQDKWHNSYDGAPADGGAWESGDGAARVIRGGGWAGNAWYCRSAVRTPFDPGDRPYYIGFRLLQEV